MADQALDNAKKKKNQLLDEISGLKKQLAAAEIEASTVDAFISQWYKFSGKPRPINLHSDDKTGDNKEQKQKIKRTTGNSKKEDVARVAREVIMERGNPIMRDNLYDILEQHPRPDYSGKRPANGSFNDALA